MAVFGVMESSEERPSVGISRIEAMNDALKGHELDMTFEEFCDFLTEASVEEAREVLFAGAENDVDRRRAGAAFLSATSALYRVGRISGNEVAERLDVARQVTQQA